MKAVLLPVVLPLVVSAAGGSAIVAKVAVPGTPCAVAGANGDVWASMFDESQVWRIHPEER